MVFKCSISMFRTAKAWAAWTEGYDFDEADKVPAWAFERLLARQLGPAAP